MSDPSAPPHHAVTEMVAQAVWDRVLRLTDHLRVHGCEVAVAELVDAAEALTAIDLGARAEVREALRCTLIKHAHHEALFDTAFDRCFAATRPQRTTDDAPAAPGVRPSGEGELGDQLRHTLGHGQDEELKVIAERAVEEFGGFEEGVRTERYHVYRVLRAIELAKLLNDVMRRAREAGEELCRAETAARIEALRRLVTEQVRARLGDGDAIFPEDATVADPFDVELARATSTELAEVKAAVRPLARRLAARLRRRRQSQRSGAVDMKRTTRRSISTGGIPLEVAYRRPHVHKPEVFSLCDVSGSVADFAGFTLTLISALSDELSATRTFAFVDAVDEITELIDGEGVIEPWQILQHGRVIGPDGHSDYGAVLRGFWDRYGRTGLTDRSTVIITGDARNNYRPEAADVLAEIARVSRWRSLGNSDTSRTLAAPTRRDTHRSRPMANPPWGGMPKRNASR
jgi:uncharacterized protein